MKTCKERLEANLTSTLEDIEKLMYKDQLIEDLNDDLEELTDEYMDFKGTSEQLAEIQTRIDNKENEIQELEDLGEFHEYGLCFDYVAPYTFTDQKKGYWRYQISYGGPSEEFRFFVGVSGELHKAEYWFLDWFDGASKDVTENTTVQDVFNWFSEIHDLTSV